MAGMKRHDTTILERRFVPQGQLVIEEGELGQQAYLIQSGEVKVYVTKDEEEIELARLDAGQIFGEMVFVFDGPRTASVKALSDTNLIVISQQQFEEKLRELAHGLSAEHQIGVRYVFPGRELNPIVAEAAG